MIFQNVLFSVMFDTECLCNGDHYDIEDTQILEQSHRSYSSKH